MPAISASAHDEPGKTPTLHDPAFPDVTVDLFSAMDGGLSLSPEEVRGRNTWLLWTAGSGAFWDRLARESNGLVDLLVTIDSRRRATRFREMGLINEPGFRAASKPDRYGLWLDEPIDPPPSSVDEATYGRSTGIMGFRLFPNPDFHGAAAAAWDPQRYRRDPDYARSPTLVRPYRVGVSCAACHVALNPCHPPQDPERPEFADLVSAFGNQYFREGRVFAAALSPGGFVWQMLEAQPPGTSDTSRVATDHINNPGAINGIFDLPARLAAPADELLTGETLLLPSLDRRASSDHSVHADVPLALKDGADSAGLAAAVLRVYVNTGLDSGDWLQCHDPLLGRTAQRPFSIAIAQRNSPEWRATERKLPDVLRFLGRLRAPQLVAAPDGATFVTLDQATLHRGRRAFAEACAGCHSSKRPPPGADRKAWFREEIEKPDFADHNCYSDGARHPITIVGTNAKRAFATNAETGHIWRNFSSETYRQLPSPGPIELWNPFTHTTEKREIPGGGTGYYRTPPLTGIWATAPLLHNNSVGAFNGDPSVAGRVAAFEDAMAKLLWPERRAGNDSIMRTEQACRIVIPGTLLPAGLRGALGSAIDGDGMLRLGPIPAGTPIDLLASIDFTAPPADILQALLAVRAAGTEIDRVAANAVTAQRIFAERAAPALMRINPCPDFVEDRGHTFGRHLSDEDKGALIEYLKTL